MFYKYSLYITLLCAGLPRTSHSTNTTKESVRASRSLHLEHAAVSLAYVRRDSLVKQPVTPPPGPPGLAGSACLETCTRVALCVSTGLLTAVLTQPLPTHTPSIAFRHLSPNSARFGYATEGVRTLHLRATVHRRGQRPPKGLGTNNYNCGSNIATKHAPT